MVLPWHSINRMITSSNSPPPFIRLPCDVDHIMILVCGNRVVLLSRVMSAAIVKQKSSGASSSTTGVGRARIAGVIRLVHEVIAHYELPSSLRTWATSRGITAYEHMFVEAKANVSELKTLLASITVPPIPCHTIPSLISHICYCLS